MSRGDHLRVAAERVLLPRWRVGDRLRRARLRRWRRRWHTPPDDDFRFSPARCRRHDGLPKIRRRPCLRGAGRPRPAERHHVEDDGPEDDGADQDDPGAGGAAQLTAAGHLDMEYSAVSTRMSAQCHWHTHCISHYFSTPAHLHRCWRLK